MRLSVPNPLAPGASTTSSGYTDGLGRRLLAFDREGGGMLERLSVRPELAAFENALRDRMERIAAVDDERIARARSIEREADGRLVVVSEFVPGDRLSELLEAAAALGSAPGVDAALGYLLDVLPALCGLHAGAGFAHGTIAPSRTVLTPAGQVVLLDAIYGGALAHLRYSRRTLWTDFGVAAPPCAGVPRLGVDADIAQVALSALMLMLGRPVRVDVYPAALPAMIHEAVEAAQIRASAEFADGLLGFLNRALAMSGVRPYAAADDALIDVRELAGELGVGVCRRALVEFAEGSERTDAQPSADDDDLPGAMAPDTPGRAGEAWTAEGDPAGPEPEHDAGFDAEIDLDALFEPPSYDLESVEIPRQDVLDASPAPWNEPVTPTGVPHVVVPAVPVRSRRAKRVRSRRDRKNKLRSAPAEPAKGTWLVPPERAAAFQPPVPDFPQAVPAAQAAAQPVPSSSVSALPAAGALGLPPSTTPASAAQAAVQGDPFWRPADVALPGARVPVLTSPACGAAPPIASPAGTSGRIVPLKVKAPARTAPPADALATAIYSSATAQKEPAPEFPWKLVAAVLLLVAGAAAAGRIVLARSGSTAVPANAARPRTAGAPEAPTRAAADAGTLQIETQPAGARVLLDGKPAGEAPLLVEAVPPGRHTVTVVSASGTVKRTVRVEPGRTVRLDVPIFSGWLAIYAPFVVEVGEGGHVIGTTEEPRLMLSPGRHVLTLTNRELAYRSVHTVDIEPGELRAVTIDPRGSVNFNATPWAEVWVDGSRIGDTPIAHHPTPLGTREAVFRHPRLGERRVMLTVRGDATAAISVDMQKR